MKKFKFQLNLDKHTEDNELFKHFVNYLLLSNELKTRINKDILNNINIEKEADFGLDGFFIVANRKIVTSPEELENILKYEKTPQISLYFIRAKTTNNFIVSDIKKFGNIIKDFISEKQKLEWNTSAKRSISLLNSLIENYRPDCYVFYCIIGNDIENKYTNRRKNIVIEKIKNTYNFRKIEFFYLDIKNLEELYKKISQRKYLLDNLQIHI